MYPEDNFGYTLYLNWAYLFQNDGELYNVTSFLEISSNHILSMGGGGISLATFSEPLNVTTLQFESTVESKQKLILWKFP